MKVSLDQIQADLPEWPLDVLEQWLLFHANDKKLVWPPPDPLGDNYWKNLIVRPLSWWRPVAWTLEERPFPNCLTRSDMLVQRKMFAGYFRGEQNAFARQIDTGPDRALNSLRYISEHNEFPRHPIALEAPNGLIVLDGAHRVLALLIGLGLWRLNGKLAEIARVRPKAEQALWVGRHPTETNFEGL